MKRFRRWKHSEATQTSHRWHWIYTKELWKIDKDKKNEKPQSKQQCMWLKLLLLCLQLDTKQMLFTLEVNTLHPLHKVSICLITSVELNSVSLITVQHIICWIKHSKSFMLFLFIYIKDIVQWVTSKASRPYLNWLTASFPAVTWALLHQF